jgi:purine-nucleoside phosphorylase
MQLDRRVQECLDVIRQVWPETAQAGLVLGSGLGSLIDAVSITAEFASADLPHFPRSTAIGHAGRLICGRIGDIPVMVMQGRCHFYEGYCWDDITFPIRVMQACGASQLFLTCAAGGLTPGLKVGDLMVFEDHINLNMHRARLPEFCTTIQPHPAIYCPNLRAGCLAQAKQFDIPCHSGIYLGVAGPNYETRAEQRFLKMFADAVGMSTIPEALTARHLGMQVCGLATITNLCTPDAPVVADGEHVLQAAAQAAPRVRRLLSALLNPSGLNCCSQETVCP